MTARITLFITSIAQLALIIPLALSGAVNATTQENRVALVIGNADYKISALKNPLHDAQDISKALRESGFDVTLKQNINQEEMDDAIRNFGEKIGRNGGTGLFYYAGHGVQVGDANYLIPIDAKIEVAKDLKYKAVNANTVLDEMQLAGNGLNIVILDACRNNPYASQFRSATRGLVKMDGPRGSILAYSTSPGSVAEDGDNRNGIYTKHLLAAMQSKNTPIEQVFKQVRIAVSKETQGKQLPWESSSLTGDFYFHTNSDVKAVQTASIAPANYNNTAAIVAEPGQPLDQIAMLLAAAESDLNAMRLTTPANENAYDKYKMVLLLDKGNREAIEGQLKITKRYLSMMDKAIANQDIQHAKRYLSRVRSLNPDPALIQGASDQLEALIVARSNGNPDNTSPAKPVQLAMAKPAGKVSKGNFSAKTIIDKLKSGKKAPELVTIPTGKFEMGDKRYGLANEQPVRWVSISKPIAIGKYEITVAQYALFTKMTGRKMPTSNSNDKTNHPVVNVSWNDAIAYTKWLSDQTGHTYRLPSEAEWEYSARAGSKAAYWWGDQIGQNQANCKSCSSQWDGISTAPVGSFKKNPFGLYDTAGNVWEWTQDCYTDSYASASSDSSAWLSGLCDRRVLRGGAWNYTAKRIRSSARSSTWPDSQYQHLGFRVVRER